MTWSEAKWFLLTGVVPALTGGLYLDPELPQATNILHLYAWIILFAIPIAITLVSTP